VYGAEKKCIQDFGGETRGNETSWKVILKWIFEKQDEGARSGVIWLRTGAGNELL
jgi:hypothetical protein